MAQEADAQAEEEAQEDARQVQVDRNDLFLDGNGGDGQYDDGRDTQTLKATSELLNRRSLEYTSSLEKCHLGSLTLSCQP